MVRESENRHGAWKPRLAFYNHVPLLSQARFLLDGLPRRLLKMCPLQPNEEKLSNQIASQNNLNSTSVNCP